MFTLTLCLLVSCHLLITFANSLEPDHARRFVGPDLDPSCLTLMVFLKEFFEKVDVENNQQTADSNPPPPPPKKKKCKITQ